MDTPAARVAALEDRVTAMEKAHADLVQELQTLLNQAMAIDPQRAQVIRARAARLNRLRNTQTPT